MMSSIQSVATQPVASALSMPMHHAGVPLAEIWSVSCVSSSQVFGGSRPSFAKSSAAYHSKLFMFCLTTTPYVLPSNVPASTMPGTRPCDSSSTLTPAWSSGVAFASVFSSSPGCGYSATSGGLPPCTRVTTTVSNCGENSTSTVLPDDCSKASSAFCRAACSFLPLMPCSSVTVLLSLAVPPSACPLCAPPPLPHAASIATTASSARNRMGHVRLIVTSAPLVAMSVWLISAALGRCCGRRSGTRRRGNPGASARRPSAGRAAQGAP